MLSAKKTYDGKIAGLYDLEETLGRGHFAVVKLARHVFTGEKVAVKVIDKTKLDEVSRAHLFQEVRCMKLVQHPNVVRLYEVIDTQTKLYLILELGDGGDLYDYIMKHEAGLGEDMAKEYFRQIVRAISYCHQLHVVHRDLKPENVVFFERLGVVKLTDFGFSNKFCPGQKLDTSCGSLAYSAPEILLGDSYDAPAVDVWSLGVILYMLVAGQAPFQEANDSETLTMIMDCKYTIPKHVSEACKRLIAKMLVREPECRATLEDIASDPWLGGAAQVEYLPLVSRHQVTDEDHNIIINKMVNGNIATKEEVLEALDKNEYNHITATYFLLAERKLRTYRQEQAQNKLKQNQTVVGIPTSKLSLGKAHSADSASSENSQIPTMGFSLNVPRTPGETTQGKVRKCSIVQEEEDEEEYCSVVGGTQELTPPISSLNRRGSRSEGKLNMAVQERIAEELRKEKRDSPGTSHPVNVNRVNSKDDVNWQIKRLNPTTGYSGVPPAYIPSSMTRKACPGKMSIHNKAEDSKALDGNFKIDNCNASGDSSCQIMNSIGDGTRKNVDSKSAEKGCETSGNTVAYSSHAKIPTMIPQIRVGGECAEFGEISLKDSATVTIPLHQANISTILEPKFKTVPNPIRSCSVPMSGFDGFSELGVTRDETTGNENGIGRKNIPSINYEQRKSKFHKGRTASCSSSDASDDDSESRKKRAHKMSMEKNNQRRDSHDDSSDGQDPGGSSGMGGNPDSNVGNEDDELHDHDQSGSNRENKSRGNGGSSSGGSNQRQCNGENFRRSRRRTGETRLRESQSLNRIVEVQEMEGANSSRSNIEVFCDRLKKSDNDNQKEFASNSRNYGSVNSEKTKSGKSLGARFLQSWSNTLSSKKLSIQKRKLSGDGRIMQTTVEVKIPEGTVQLPKLYSDEKENKASVEKTGKKMKVLSRYFQVSKKISIPLPNLSAKGRLYKARSCGSITKDKITMTTQPSGASTLKLGNSQTIVRNENSNGVYYSTGKTPGLPTNQSLGSVYANNNCSSLNKLPNKSAKEKRVDDSNSKVSINFRLENFKDDINRNVSNSTGVYNCPDVGICQMHMRDAAKCHLS